MNSHISRHNADKSSWCLIVRDMIPSAFLVAVVFLSCCYIVRCNLQSSCNSAVNCADNTTVCETDFCHIQAGQICTEETTTTVAITLTTPAQTITTTRPTQPGATSQSSNTTAAPTTTTTTLTTTATTTSTTTTT
ncbi:hypothetical protein DPMN_121712 [Dreissena polymorpha]|uniref:Uncharacterized protein n=1 Tax=Dreissena polymorpha TaxID=45954 RepID=A0A9D4GN92_DREPO|nr:hypothetical protein DPMN_121712 [Dreissena polymorpha]